MQTVLSMEKLGLEIKKMAVFQLLSAFAMILSIKVNSLSL